MQLCLRLLCHQSVLRLRLQFGQHLLVLQKCRLQLLLHLVQLQQQQLPLFRRILSRPSLRFQTLMQLCLFLTQRVALLRQLSLDTVFSFQRRLQLCLFLTQRVALLRQLSIDTVFSFQRRLQLCLRLLCHQSALRLRLQFGQHLLVLQKCRLQLLLHLVQLQQQQFAFTGCLPGSLHLSLEKLLQFCFFLTQLYRLVGHTLSLLMQRTHMQNGHLTHLIEQQSRILNPRKL